MLTRKEFSYLVTCFAQSDESVQLTIIKEWPTFKRIFQIIELDPLAWTILKSAINEIYPKVVSKSN